MPNGCSKGYARDHSLGLAVQSARKRRRRRRCRVDAVGDELPVQARSRPLGVVLFASSVVEKLLSYGFNNNFRYALLPLVEPFVRFEITQKKVYMRKLNHGRFARSARFALCLDFAV